MRLLKIVNQVGAASSRDKNNRTKLVLSGVEGPALSLSKGWRSYRGTRVVLDEIGIVEYME
jgi:hypothetical protein